MTLVVVNPLTLVSRVYCFNPRVGFPIPSMYAYFQVPASTASLREITKWIVPFLFHSGPTPQIAAEVAAQ